MSPPPHHTIASAQVVVIVNHGIAQFPSKNALLSYVKVNSLNTPEMTLCSDDSRIPQKSWRYEKFQRNPKRLFNTE